MGKITNTSDAPRIDWLFGSNPNAIHAQETKGQQELVNSSQLPRIGNFDVKHQYEKMGIKVIGETIGDNLFLDVELPKGWKLKSTDHSMHSDLIDKKGRKRASIFYKAAFYDRKADISFVKRIGFRVDRLAFLEDNYSLVDGEQPPYPPMWKTDYGNYSAKGLDCDGVPLFSHGTANEIVKDHTRNLSEYQPLTVEIVNWWFGWLLYQLKNNKLTFGLDIKLKTK